MSDLQAICCLLGTLKTMLLVVESKRLFTAMPER
jgi:hypothetical protein